MTDKPFEVADILSTLPEHFSVVEDPLMVAQTLAKYPILSQVLYEAYQEIEKLFGIGTSVELSPNIDGDQPLIAKIVNELEPKESVAKLWQVVDWRFHHYKNLGSVIVFDIG